MARTFGESRASPAKIEPWGAPARPLKRPLVAIVGGGATGVLAAAHLERAGVAKTCDIAVVEPRDDLGRGLAYSTFDPLHLLNVRVANMSAFEDDQDHLLDWLRLGGRPYGEPIPSPYAFLSRWIYGAYMTDLARGLVAGGALRHVPARCVGVKERAGAAELELDSGETLAASRVLLATGNDATPARAGFDAEPPWSQEALANLPYDADVMILGSGLTMVDMALSLHRRGHVGKIHVLSRRGLMPNAHRPVAARRFERDAIPVGAPLSELTRWLIGQARSLQLDGGDWRSAIDALRPHTTSLWQAMSLEQRGRFLRHLRPYWDAHRHRMAPEIEHKFSRLVEMGQVRRIAGRLAAGRSTEGGIEITFRRRGALATDRLLVARMIDCTGFAGDIRDSKNPLIRSVLASGAARPGPLGLGLDVGADFALLDAQGRASKRVSAIGPLARGAFWECTAIPDIRGHCRDYAALVAREVARGEWRMGNGE